MPIRGGNAGLSEGVQFHYGASTVTPHTGGGGYRAPMPPPAVPYTPSGGSTLATYRHGVFAMQPSGGGGPQPYQAGGQHPSQAQPPCQTCLPPAGGGPVGYFPGGAAGRTRVAGGAQPAGGIGGHGPGVVSPYAPGQRRG